MKYLKRIVLLLITVILIAVLCRYVSGKAIAGDDAIDSCWLHFDEIEMRCEQLIPQVAEVAHRALIFIKNNKEINK